MVRAVSAPSNNEGQRLYRTGLQLVRQGRLDGAIRTFEKALSHDSQNPALLDAAGAAYSLKGDFVRATEYFQASLRIDSNFVPARKNLAITYFNQRQYDLAASEFQALSANPGSSKEIARLFLGVIAEKKGDYAQSAVLLEDSRRLLYSYPQALIAYANAQLQLKHAEKATAALKAFEATSGPTAAQYLQAAQLHSQLGQDHLALADIAKARDKDSHLDGLDYQHAVVLDRTGRSQEALQILKVLTARNPNGDSLNLLAHVAEKNREFALAMDSLRQAAKIDPDNEENYLDFSTICADYGNYPLALQAADVGLSHVPDSYRLMVQKGVVLENLGRLDDAEATLRTASTLQKDNSVALLSLSIVQTHAGQLEEADTTLTAALHDFPDNFYMHYQLGKVLVQIQEGRQPDADLASQAAHAFQEAIRLKPSFSDSYYQLSKLHLRENPKLAEQNLVTCLRLDPTHAPAEYTLARLYLSTGRQAAGQALIDRFESQQRAAKLKEQQKPRIESTQR